MRQSSGAFLCSGLGRSGNSPFGIAPGRSALRDVYEEGPPQSTTAGPAARPGAGRRTVRLTADLRAASVSSPLAAAGPIRSWGRQSAQLQVGVASVRAWSRLRMTLLLARTMPPLSCSPSCRTISAGWSAAGARRPHRGAAPGADPDRGQGLRRPELRGPGHHRVRAAPGPPGPARPRTPRRPHHRGRLHPHHPAAAGHGRRHLAQLGHSRIHQAILDRL